MIDHTGIGVANVACSAAFYDAGLGSFGLRCVMHLGLLGFESRVTLARCAASWRSHRKDDD